MDVRIRDMEANDIIDCIKIVEENWDKEIGIQAYREMWEMFISNSIWPPHYYVATDQNGKILGFAGFKSTWLMSNTFELIWVNISKDAQRQSIGTFLTNVRLEEIKKRGGNLVLLMSQKPTFFERFGFKSVQNLDGWHLMTYKMAPIQLGPDNARPVLKI